MFARVLYIDDQVSLHINWLGLGALVVMHRLGGKRKAHPIQRRAFLAACSAFEKEGQPLTPDNPKCAAMMADVAEMLLRFPPSAPVWRMMYDDPEHFGMRYAR